VSGHTPWREIAHKSAADPSRVAVHRRAMERELRAYGRVGRLVQFARRLVRSF